MKSDINCYMNIKDILNQPEGRRLEFKAKLLEKSDLAKATVFCK